MARVNGRPALQAITRPGYTYQLQVRDSLDAGDWTNHGQPFEGAAGTHDFSDESAVVPARRFYRIVVQ